LYSVKRDSTAGNVGTPLAGVLFSTPIEV